MLEQSLTKYDIQRSVGDYSTAENQSVHFRISISVQLLNYHDHTHIKIPVPSRNITIEQLLQSQETLTDVHRYLAMNDTKRIIEPNEILLNLNKTKFILVKENEICLVSIKKPDDSHDDQRFATFATIADVYKENQMDVLHQYLLYSNDFVPSIGTSLILLQSESSVQFTLINQNLPVTVTIQTDDKNKSIKFNCSFSFTIKRTYAISCQLFGVNKDYYCLTFDDSTLNDDDLSVEDINENKTEIQFQMISTASMHCLITHSGKTITLPCREDTQVLSIVGEALQTLRMPNDNINMYELIALTDDPTRIDFDLSIEDVKQLFSSDTATIALELKKNE